PPPTIRRADADLPDARSIPRLSPRAPPIPGDGLRGKASAALELGLALSDERFVGLAEVVRVHADLLRLRLGLERLPERHGGLAVEHLLGHAERERWAFG